MGSPLSKWSPREDGNPCWNGLGGMKENLEVLGYSDEELRKLNVIHVAGTKGKGSTCAFINAFLKAHGDRTGFPKRIGLYTSPHLVHHRERFRINMNPLSEQKFTQYFFEIWDKIYENASQNSYRMPGYLQLLKLLNYNAWFNHTGVLGPLIENIAWHKGGIFKPETPALSSAQTPAAIQVLQQRAHEKGVQLQVIEEDPSLPRNVSALKAEVQRVNASLARAMTSEFLKVKALEGTSGLILDDVVHGLEKFTWPGRFHHINNGPCQWYIDIAHNEISVKAAADWFSKASLATLRPGSKLVRVLNFSHHFARDGITLIKSIAECLKQLGVAMQHVILTPSGNEGREITSKDNESSALLSQSDDLEQYAQVWRSIDASANIFPESSISRVLEVAKNLADEAIEMHALITGTTPLVGPALDLVKKDALGARTENAC